MGYFALGYLLGDALFNGDDSDSSSAQYDLTTQQLNLQQQQWQAEFDRIGAWHQEDTIESQVINLQAQLAQLYSYRNRLTTLYGNTHSDDLSFINQLISGAVGDLNRLQSQGSLSGSDSTFTTPGLNFPGVEQMGSQRPGQSAITANDQQALENYFNNGSRPAENSYAAYILENGIDSNFLSSGSPLAPYFSNSGGTAFATNTQSGAFADPSNTGLIGQFQTLRDQVGSTGIPDFSQESGMLTDALAQFEGSYAKPAQDLRSSLTAATDTFSAAREGSLAEFEQGVGLARTTFEEGLDKALNAMGEQADFYKSLIKNPGLASDHVKILLQQAQSQLVGEEQRIKDYYARIGRSGSGAERKEIENLSNQLAVSFAENMAFTSEYGRTQSIELAKEEAALTREGAEFELGLSKDLYGAQVGTANDILGAESDAAKSIYSAESVLPGQLLAAQQGTAQSLANLDTTQAGLQQSQAQILAQLLSGQAQLELSLGDLPYYGAATGGNTTSPVTNPTVSPVNIPDFNDQAGSEEGGTDWNSLGQLLALYMS
jgi:hypothetical protein